MSTDERRARAIAWGVRPHLHRHYDANQNRSVLTPKDRLKYLGIARAIRTSDKAALGLRPDQLQPDEDSPGLYIQCATTEQRRQIMAMLAAATESDNG